MLIISITFVLVYLSQQQPPFPIRSDEACREPLDRGQSNCNVSAPGMRWFFDKELDECFEYYYEGCGGGLNTFEDSATCRRACQPADRGRCGGNAKSMGTCIQFEESCPPGSRCEMGPMNSGICCDIENEEEWEKERNPKCETGSLSMRVEWYGETPRLGKKCEHKFCPDGYKCIETKRLAHCCSEN